MPLLGNIYAISIFEEGPNAVSERRLMRAALIKELGEPKLEDMKDTSLELFFMSDDQSIPRTRVHSVLGEERIAQHCAALSAEERAAIDEVLAAMEVLLRDIAGKAKATAAILSKLPPERVIVVNEALMGIIMEFAQKSPSH